MARELGDSRILRGKKVSSIPFWRGRGILFSGKKILENNIGEGVLKIVFMHVYI